MRILLVNMPFSSIRPPLGISLLKSHLHREGFEATVFNANLAFARRVGTRFYHYICEVAPPESLLGEWLFSHLVFRDHNVEPYLESLASDFPREFSPAAVARLLQARALADDFLDECLKVVLSGGYEFVGFTSSFTQNMASLALAKRIKKQGVGTLVAFGGANCEGIMGLALHRNFPFVDLVFSGEADLSFPRTIHALARGEIPSGIPGVVWRTATGGSEYKSLEPERVKDMDDLPFPNYDDFFEQYKSLPDGSRISGIPMETSRGCWWGEKSHCTFCGLNGLAMTFRPKSASRALAEIEYLQERYNVRDIQMVDNILDMRYLKTLLPAIAGRRLKPALFYQTKGNLTREHIELFNAAGIRAIQVGIESLDSGVLRLMRKGMTGMRAIELLKHCREVGIWPHWNILFGFPDEPADAYAQMADLVGAITHLDPPNVCTRFRLDRFSPMFVAASEFGLTNVRPAKAYLLLYDLPEDQVREIAYYFDFDYCDGRVPKLYASQLCARVQEWQESRDGDLIYEDSLGVTRIVDTRCGRQRETLLSGIERRIYLRCVTSQTLRCLEDEFGPELAPLRTVADVLGKWTEQQLMVGLDGRYLSLAVAKTAASRWRRIRKPSWHEVLKQSLTLEPTTSQSQKTQRGLFATSRATRAGRE